MFDKEGEVLVVELGRSRSSIHPESISPGDAGLVGRSVGSRRGDLCYHFGKLVRHER